VPRFGSGLLNQIDPISHNLNVISSNFFFLKAIDCISSLSLRIDASQARQIFGLLTKPRWSGAGIGYGAKKWADLL